MKIICPYMEGKKMLVFSILKELDISSNGRKKLR